MSTIDLKKILFKQIEDTDDDEILEEVHRILELGSYQKSDNQISNELKKSIDQGIKDFEEGKLVSHEQAKQEFKEWLNQ